MRPDPALSHDEGVVCACSTDHRPAVLEFVDHHVWPLGMGGPDEPENVARICPTTHYNVHEILRLMLRGGRLSYPQCQAIEHPRVVSRYAYTLALRGFDEWRATQT